MLEEGLTGVLAYLQASESELKEDREIICAEVFSDVTGELDELAQGALGHSNSPPSNCQTCSPQYLRKSTAPVSTELARRET